MHALNTALGRKSLLLGSGLFLTVFGCTDSPGPSAPGEIVVTVTTTGADLDPDGYAVWVEGDSAQPAEVPDNGGSATFADLAEGAHSVTIGGVAANCAVSGQASATVAVTSSTTARVAFRVVCAAFGALRITATTSGQDLDPDGYTVQLAGQRAQSLLDNGGEVTYSQLAPGPVQLTLAGVRANCAPSPTSPVTVQVPSGATAAVAFDVACVQIMPTGSALAFVRNISSNLEIALVTGNSLPRDLTNNAAADDSPAWSPDGTKIAFVTGRDGNREIYLMNPDGSGQVNLTNSPAFESTPVWSPDGSRIAFVSDRDGNLEIYAMNTDGSGQVNLTGSPADESSPVWSPDGTRIAFVSGRDGNQEIYVMNADGSGQIDLTGNPGMDASPVWSPDGRRIAFVSARDGNAEIYLMNADGTGQLNVTNSPEADTDPAWSPDGRQIAFTGSGIGVVGADGFGLSRLAGTGSRPAWSPDGCPNGPPCRPHRFARSGISVMAPDGSAQVALVDDAVPGNGSPVWKLR